MEASGGGAVMKEGFDVSSESAQVKKSALAVLVVRHALVSTSRFGGS